MATIETKQPRQKAGVKRLMKKATRVDLTPMVDLGFLLITFFVFTTTMARPQVMKLNEPNDKDPTVTTDICASCALTLIPASNGVIYYYEGMATAEAVKSTTYHADGLRELIIQKKASVAALNDPSKKLILIIKPGNGSNVQNFVDLIDETLINRVLVYFIAEPDEVDRKLLPGVWE